MGLSDKTAIVTGGANGIGRAVVLCLAEDGADMAIGDIDTTAAWEVAVQVESLGRKCVPLSVDVADNRSVVEFVNKVIENFGRIDILVNCAGTLGPVKPVWEMKEEEWDRLVDIHLKGTFLCCKAVIKHMLNRRKGKIVNVSSVSGKEGNPNFSAYSAAKAGVIAFTKSLAKEVAICNINVNCISPALIETRMLKEMSKDQRKTLLGKIPMGRVGKPEEVATLVKFLVSEESDFITAQCYDISGGRSVY